MTARADEEAEKVVLDFIERICIVSATRVGRHRSYELGFRGLCVSHWKDLYSRQIVEAAKTVCQGLRMCEGD